MSRVSQSSLAVRPEFDVCALNLIVEVTGERKKDKAAKVTTARALWVPAINNHGGFGRWTFIEVADPWDAQNLIRGFLIQLHVEPTKEVAHG